MKWQSIRAKLEDLLSDLENVENSLSGENPSLSGEISPILETLRSVHVISHQCVELNYSGKLLMQSDLDIIISKLENHIKTLDEIYTVGLLRHSYAIVVSKPNFSASKDDIEFYLNDLFTRLKIGGTELKKQGLVSFNEAIQEDEKYIKIAFGCFDFVSVLANSLDSDEIDIQEEAAKALSLISKFGDYKSVLINFGLIAPLIRVLERGSESGKKNSALCLINLTENADNAWSISAHGGVTILLKICLDSSSSGELVNFSCRVLQNLVGVEEIKRFMVEEGAILGFIGLLRSKDEVVIISSIEFLQEIAFNDELIRQLIVREDGLRLMVRVLDPKLSNSSKLREVALKGIANLCFFSMGSFSILLNYMFLDHVLFHLRHGEISIQELALKMVFKLCGLSEEIKKIIGDCGFMPELIKFLDAKSYEVRETATETLSTLLLVPKNRKRFVQNEQNVGLILKLLDSENRNLGTQSYLLSILMLLTNCNSGRKKILHSGYVKNIQKLAEAEVSDAKKIVRKLSSNRIRSMLSAIWHS